MFQRAVAVPLWFFTGWVVGAVAAVATGIVFLPIVTATAAAAFVWLDPSRKLWISAS